MHEVDLPLEAQSLLARLRGVSDEAERLKKQFERDIAEARKAIDARQKESVRAREVAEALVRDRISGFELLAEAWADYETARSETLAEQLRRKKRPALKAADEVKAKGQELADVRRRAKLSEWLVRYYEWYFPWLTEFRDLEAEQGYLDEGNVDDGDESDPARRWLTAEEFAGLSSAERNQRALDRYLRSRKTPWQVGRDYERYVGYLREQEGCQVSYHGIFKGLEDLGRDLLAERNGQVEVIQCKRWAQAKTIHEKHIFQLFGTVVAARIENPGKTVTGTFVTTTSLSERAREFARQLEIKVEESFPLSDYPRIKCNIAHRTEERIYHLPFDQQYDTTVIEPERGESYVSTVAEAEALGFRRAWHWRGNAAETTV
jgi:hypothetical protein